MFPKCHNKIYHIDTHIPVKLCFDPEIIFISSIHLTKIFSVHWGARKMFIYMNYLQTRNHNFSIFSHSHSKKKYICLIYEAYRKRLFMRPGRLFVKQTSTVSAYSDWAVNLDAA